MTSLAHQLKRLALPQNDAALLQRKHVASILYNPREAAAMDRSEFYAQGCTGLDELLGIEAEFSEFQETLFSTAALTLERSVQTKEVNKKLDKSISLFLTRLSPYFLLKPALKCLEWLVHRFHIHLYNQDSLISCALPYHETTVFVRVVQILNIDDPTHKWHWLHGLQKAGLPLARSTLLTHCYKDLGFMDFICTMVTRSVKAYSGSVRDGKCPQLRVIFSFYVAAVVPALEAVEKVTDSIVAKLLPYIQLGLKSELLDYKAASYMVVSELAVKVVMQAELLDSLAVQVSRSMVRAPTLDSEGLACLIVLLQNQKERGVGPKSFKYLCTMPTLVPTLQGLAARYDISPLLRYLLPCLVESLTTQEDESQAEESDSTRSGQMLQSVLHSLPLNPDLEKLVVRLLFDSYMSSSALSSHAVASLNQKVKPIVRLLEQKYPAALDTLLESGVSDVMSEQQKELFQNFLSLTLGGGKYQVLADSDTSLLLSLNHPLWSVRNMAIEHLKKSLTSGQDGFDKVFVRDALTERIKDECPSVVLSALSVLQLLPDCTDADETVSSLISLLHRVQPADTQHWCPVLKEVVRTLDASALGQDNPDLSVRIGWELLPFSLVTSPQPESAELQLAMCVAETRLLSQHPLTRGWADVLKELLQTTPPSDLIGAASQLLINTMTENLSSMEPSAKRSTIEKMCVLLSRPGGTVRERGVFIVLSHALLQDLECLGESHHLHTAQTFLTLLEPFIRKLYTLDTQEPVMSQSEGSGMPVLELLGAYLSRLHSGWDAEWHHGLLILSLLHSFISTLKCPESTFKDEVWWNPEKLDASTCCYLQLLCRLFDLVVSGAGEGLLALRFRALMKQLLQRHMSDPLHLFKFLSLLWGYSSNLGDQLEVRVPALLQTQALYMGRALLSGLPAQTRHALSLFSSPVVPSLLLALSSGVTEVRRAALAFLRTLSGANSALDFTATPSPYHPLLERLLTASEELTADPAYLHQALGSLFEEAAGCSKLMEVFEQLLLCVSSPDCPSYTAKIMLRALQDVNGESVLSLLLPPLERLLEQCVPDTPVFLPDEALLLQLLLGKYNAMSAPLLARHARTLELFIAALRTSSRPYAHMPSFQIIALDQITKPFFAALGVEVQQRILGVLFDLLEESRDPTCSQAISSVFKAISVDAEQVANELVPADRARVSGSVQQSRRSKMSRKVQDAPAETGSAVSWPRVTLVLELLQRKKKMRRPQMLVPALFTLLSRCLEASVEQENVEYTKQLLLSVLLNICHKLSPQGGALSNDVLDEDKFSVELVVQCVRTSDVPQTHHHALLLLATVAGIFPEKVLHNIMPIFTFMGANILRLDDSYSFQVISRTVQTVIPALIHAQEGTSGSAEMQLETLVTRVLHVFIDALPHVPEHRRVPVLRELMGTLGPTRFLWVLMLLLFKQHATCTSALGADKEAVVEQDVELWVSVCSEFEVWEQLSALTKILQFLSALPREKEERVEKKNVRGARVKKKEESLSELIFSVEAHSGKELRHFKFLSVSFMAHLLSSSSFVGKMVECEDLSEHSLQELQQRLLEESLRYIHSTAQCVEENTDKPTAKFWRALLSKAYDLLDKVNALLPTDTFITVVRGLMGNHLPSVRRKAMELLNNRLQQRTDWEEQQVSVLLGMMGDLLNVAARGRGQVRSQQQEEEEEQTVNRQTALYSLKLLCRSFGAGHREAFVPVLSRTVELVERRDEERNVTCSAMLCVAEVTSILKALAIPHIHRLMPAVLQALTQRKDLLSNEVYLLSAVTTLQKVVETLPHFISPYLDDTVSQVTRLTRLAERLASCPQLSTRVSSLSSTLATAVPARVLMPTITRCYSTMQDTQQSRLGPLMNILKGLIGHMEKEELNSHQAELTSFFLNTLDFRAKHCQGELEKTWEIEGYVIDCLLVMIMKLSEETFRPFFCKLLEWSRAEGESRERVLTFCRLTDCIADRLKGLFVLFSGQLVKPFSELLLQLNCTHTDEAYFSSGEDDDEDVCVKKSCMLLQCLLSCLKKLFLYDTHHFLSKERADALQRPLLDQLENTLGGEELHENRVKELLVPCIGQFAVAMGDDAQWKDLNYQLLLKTRHSSSRVRLSALLAVLEVARKLKENYMVLLPETIPFLAELMEDECEEVEQQVQKVIQEMESILGEPLQSYF